MIKVLIYNFASLLDCGSTRRVDKAILTVASSIEVYDDGDIVSLPQKLVYACDVGYGTAPWSRNIGICVAGENGTRFAFGDEMLNDFPECVLGRYTVRFIFTITCVPLIS